jgi:hypothetical protein
MMIAAVDVEIKGGRYQMTIPVVITIPCSHLSGML